MELNNGTESFFMNSVWESEVYDLVIPRKVPSEIIDAIEQEREYRIAHGSDPVLLGKLHKVQAELITKLHPPTIESLDRAAIEAKNVLSYSWNEIQHISDQFSVEVNGKMKKYEEEWMESLAQCKEKVAGFVLNSVDYAKDRIMGQPAVKYDEYHVDPIVAARLYRLEKELIETVKPK